MTAIASKLEFTPMPPTLMPDLQAFGHPEALAAVAEQVGATELPNQVEAPIRIQMRSPRANFLPQLLSDPERGETYQLPIELPDRYVSETVVRGEIAWRLSRDPHVNPRARRMRTIARRLGAASGTLLGAGAVGTIGNVVAEHGAHTGPVAWVGAALLAAGAAVGGGGAKWYSSWWRRQPTLAEDTPSPVTFEGSRNTNYHASSHYQSRSPQYPPSRQSTPLPSSGYKV